jgi:hypothetical protein
VCELSQATDVILVAGLVAAAYLALTIWRRRLESNNEASGTIRIPEGTREVSGPLRLEGDLSTIPRAHHVWVAFESQDLLFPREPEIPARPGRFAVEIAPEEAPGGPFSLVLVLVGAKGQRAIEYWLLQGALGEGYPGFERIPGASQLDAVHGLALKPDRAQSSARDDLASRPRA